MLPAIHGFRRSDATRRVIFDALLSLLDEMPYEKINISAVTQRAGVSRQSFYRHYASKDDIILHYVSVLLERAAPAISGTPDRARIQEVYASFLGFLCANRNKVAKIINSRLELLILEPLEKINTLIVEKLCHPEGGKLRGEERYLVRYRSGGVINIILGWLHYGMDEPAEHMAALISRLLTSPVTVMG